MVVVQDAAGSHRPTQQILDGKPLEIDPPEHADYRDIVEPFFRRATQPDYIAKMEALIAELIADAAKRESIEIVREFAIHPIEFRQQGGG